LDLYLYLHELGKSNLIFQNYMVRTSKLCGSYWYIFYEIYYLFGKVLLIILLEILRYHINYI